ncbi:hypothetical protein EKO27_g10738 [Xylaria grammica]|uniref:Uncharacterized protein n=1 Tax=Xylaria grammica TaxID=363999 RepID=A0A439CQC8_9PEZI|nr:hypothetical protein EKO27_g10738 [Xylaria grammica]
MARESGSRPASTTSSEAHARLLYDSLEKYNEEQRKRKRPSVILVALIVLFLSSAGGITLAIVLMAKTIEIEAVCFSRDFILFAGVMSLLYIGLHICAARRDYKRGGPGPPQMYGQYLHASALLVARLSIVIWIGALVATAVMIARAIPLEGFSGKVPFLDLLLCVGAISPSFLIISITIEKNPAPFATASISSASVLTCRVSQFADDLTADSSVSRRSSLQRRQSEARSVLTMSTEDMFRLGAAQLGEKNTAAAKRHESSSEKIASLPMAETHHPPPRENLSHSDPPPTQAVPQPTYYPGGWRAEWNNAAQIPGNSTDRPSSSGPPPPPQHRSQGALGAPSTKPASSPQPSQPITPLSANNINNNNTTTTTASIPTQQYRYSHRWSGSAAPSNLSTVRYASEPEIAVQQSIRVVRNPAYQARSSSAGTITTTGAGIDRHKGLPNGEEKKPIVISRPDAALLRNAQLAQNTGAESQGANGSGSSSGSGLQRKPSNFSRPMQTGKAGADTDGKVEGKAEVSKAEGDLGGGVKIPGAFVEDADEKE